jgi:hypothetical protein
MSKLGLYSDRSAIVFENHLEGLEEEKDSTTQFKKLCKKSW